jgi:hypothetical protein
MLPINEMSISGTKHYFRYFGDNYKTIRFGAIKSRFLTSVLHLIRKIASHRKIITILDVGSTIGETYLLAKRGDPGRVF